MRKEGCNFLVVSSRLRSVSLYSTFCSQTPMGKDQDGGGAWMPLLVESRSELAPS